MNHPSNAQKNRGGPKEKDKHYSYNESVDETAKLDDAEPVEVEAEVPAEENEPIDPTVIHQTSWTELRAQGPIR